MSIKQIFIKHNLDRSLCTMHATFCLAPVQFFSQTSVDHQLVEREYLLGDHGHPECYRRPEIDD